MKRKILFILIAILMIFILGGCTPTEKPFTELPIDRESYRHEYVYTNTNYKIETLSHDYYVKSVSFYGGAVYARGYFVHIGAQTGCVYHSGILRISGNWVLTEVESDRR